MLPGAVTGVVLAAGPSERFRSKIPKQVQLFEGEALVKRITRRALASRLAEVLVVVGYRADLVREALLGLDVRIAENPVFSEGQSTSVKAGLAAVDPASAGAMFLPCDQPFVTTQLIDELIDAWTESAARIVVPAHQDRRGSPVVIDRSLFAELAEISGDEGGRQLFARHAAEIVELPLQTERPLLDIDTVEDLDRLS
jgi:molybdenum cofactor cytidylyltransferase